MAMQYETGLTARELETLQALGRGHTYKTGAKVLGVAPCTFSDHVKSLYRKLGVNTAHGAVAAGFRKGLLTRARCRHPRLEGHPMNIEAMAREATGYDYADSDSCYAFTQNELERFAALVLEEAARVCEGRARDHWDHEGPALACADAIRALAATKPGT